MVVFGCWIIVIRCWARVNLAPTDLKKIGKDMMPPIKIGTCIVIRIEKW